MQRGRRVVRASEIGRWKLLLWVFAHAQRCLAPFLLIMRAHYLRTCHSTVAESPERKGLSVIREVNKNTQCQQVASSSGHRVESRFGLIQDRRG